MALVASTPSARLSLGALRRWMASALVLAGCAGFMFFNVRTPPIILWDESRMAVNALEMHLSGHMRLVTTYGFQPDLWNTKPPLLIWLMDMSASLFGVSEWSLRLPSMIAAMGTLALVMSFTRRVTQSFLAGALAAVLLALSVLFFAEHGARTADYEALLCFLTTAYLYVLFFALHRRRPHSGLVMAAGGLIAAAILTKSVAGLLPGVGVGLYLVVVGRWKRPLQSPWYMAAGALALGLGAAYFLLREHAAPGYLKAVMFNDVSGRFTSALDRHSGPPWYYLKDFFVDGAFSAGMLAAAAPLALISARGRERLGLIFSLCVTAGILAVLSVSATKLNHYGITACPFIAIFTAIGAHEGLKALGRANARGQVQVLTPRTAYVLLALVLGVIAARSAYARVSWLAQREVYPQASYGELFSELSARGVRSVRVVEGGVVRPGVAADGVARDYAPQLDFYRLLAESRGMDVVRIAPGALKLQTRGVVLATCDPSYAPQLTATGANLTAIPGCVAVRPKLSLPAQRGEGTARSGVRGA
jgi:4-amino-4-deoxy-L-arabinose transferase-like glycosyltransferase